MKKSIIPSVLTGGAVIAIIAVLIVSMLFVCLGDTVDNPKYTPQQGMPQIIAPDSGEGDGDIPPVFDFNDTDGYLEIKLEGSTLFMSDTALHIRNTLRVKELYGKTVTVTDIKYSVYSSGECVYTGYADIAELMKSAIIGGGGFSSFRHTIELYDSSYMGNVTVLYTISWQDSDGNVGVSSCKKELSGS